jgi:hypothetical protein
MALYMMCFMGGTPVGAPVIGWVSENLGAPWGLVLGGVVCVVSGVGAGLWLSRGRRVRVEAHVVPPRLTLHVGHRVAGSRRTTARAALGSPAVRAVAEEAAAEAPGTPTTPEAARRAAS